MTNEKIKLNRIRKMNRKEIEKESYDSPVINKQQVILEQVIAAGSTRKYSKGTLTTEFLGENIEIEDIVIF